MLAKIWKKVFLIILIIACLYNIVNKLTHRNSFKKEMQDTAIFAQELKEDIVNEVETRVNTISNREKKGE